MNYALAREIYGNKPMMVDCATFSSMLSMLNDFRNGTLFEKSDTERFNSICLYSVQSATKVVKYAEQVDARSDDEYISLINLNGPITKNGGLSSYGTKELGAMMLAFDADPKIIGHIILADSGGGSAAGMEVMNYAIDQLTKPKVSVIERGGGAYSAAYGIIAHTDRIFGESGKSQAGSIGTMISFKAQPNKTINADGEKQVTIYATPSTKKNLWFEEALNNDNYELALDEILNPHVELFRSDMQSRRPGLDESHLDGSVYDATDAIGTLVDEIGGISEAVNYIKSQQNQSKIITKNKSKTAMTAQELQAQHPAVYAEILGAGRTAGVAAERDRVGAWMAHANTDLDAVKTGITGGGEISATAREEFMVKANAKALLESLKKDSAKAVNTPEASSTETAPTEVEAFYAKVKEGLK